MIDVCGTDMQADCHLLSLADGTFAVIDPADAPDAPGSALAYLKKRDVDALRLVVISHFHKDHYGRLRDFVNAGIRVERVAINLPGDRRIADREMPWGCDWEDVQSLLAFLKEKGIPYFTPKAGERLLEVEGDGVMTTLDTICLYDGITTPVGETDINDTSIVLRFTHGKTRVLFTGDLNLRLGAYLATSDFDLRADILKVPHHGTEGVAPNEFFQRVGASVAMVPAPRNLWLSIRSKRVRDFFRDAGAVTFVSGVNGNVTVRFTRTGFEIRPERRAGRGPVASEAGS
jgi:competence protein ComEC